MDDYSGKCRMSVGAEVFDSVHGAISNETMRTLYKHQEIISMRWSGPKHTSVFVVASIHTDIARNVRGVIQGDLDA